MTHGDTVKPVPRDAPGYAGHLKINLIKNLSVQQIYSQNKTEKLFNFDGCAQYEFL